MLASMDEIDMRDANHLWYECRECGSESEDHHLDILHDGECAVGKAAAALAEVRGQEVPSS